MLEEDQEAELRNPFPSPPSHYQNYSSHNLNLLSLLKERQNEENKYTSQQELLKDQEDVPDWPLTQLEKPRVDWIVEDGSYTVFGDTWPIKEKIPSLGEEGGHQLYPDDPTIDRRPVLISILKSMLVTYSGLIKSLLAPPPNPYSTDPPEWVRHVEWLTILSQNIMSAANDLRPVQARVNLEAMMERQLELRRQETVELKKKCSELSQRLAKLKQAAASQVENKPSSSININLQATSSQVSIDDVRRWAENA
ncbi:mediator subunit med7 [Pyrrhoderma noxium]|uniref:Mediator of RNA polymerase II transcription subunit 7 n=1 Tax=Pyrrhoderma noxium TaxID=2282107 RepID=A0A286USE7_9AGAM|nr:mediator subunit med7 [Pyrrhoderma noxium]